MDKKIRLFADCKCALSESPIWNKRDKKLYWRGFHGEIYRKPVSDNTDDFECFQLAIGNIGSIVFTDGDSILLFGDAGKIWRWKPGEDAVLYKDFEKALFNDVITDAKGRVYCGMLAEHYFDIHKRGKHGSLWMLENGNLTCLEKTEGTTPNGIRFSPDMKKMYFAVTDEDCIYVYDYDAATGKIANKKVFATGCHPDGITVDSKGNLWVANCRPGKPLVCYDENGKKTDEIYIDTYRVISVAFGGENNDMMFVATACEKEMADGKNGGVFLIENVGVGSKEYTLDLEGDD